MAELPGDANHDTINTAIEAFSADQDDMKSSTYDLVGSKRKAIDAIFGKATAEEMIAGLKSLEEGTYNVKELEVVGETMDLVKLQAWAKTTRETIELRSPTSVKVSLMAIREGKLLDIDEAFLLDMRIATACCVRRIFIPFFIIILLLTQSNGEFYRTLKCTLISRQESLHCSSTNRRNCNQGNHPSDRIGSHQRSKKFHSLRLKASSSPLHPHSRTHLFPRCLYCIQHPLTDLILMRNMRCRVRRRFKISLRVRRKGVEVTPLQPSR